ncbi:MAG: hypothetical protein UV57_C0010G0002 [Parcubacteria group bacterium GW2011_GWD2_43_10]|uniref:RNHCP domain-containing protein n=1 Tax=Candidatus Veblenbacteria bacterium RIFOXYC2_FULL_42_11 TaxID=1802428 RepID=A0A1G2QA02_9BACT|nr:MAG: hypothetical protein UV57_C0010G0002 [Parcubacteria group bacterium GW2011_GWD2_43_10]OHA57396.1 MAG: hypothetical protein A2441_01425 [Candidatus Veblenbacteria bacterium RIFOXYC2_FULL_42_11]HBT91946.1 hypothetical protein [Candidatus Veblenbacteria bacterium]HCX39326.1 hypothetical protein [Candidatus Veblenbacteria bacterium]
MPKKFQKRAENFTCNNCGQVVQGTGYTNHCPKCLWSKHVDINPGDRLSSCDGMMPPMGLFLREGEKLIVHRCSKCGLEKFNKVQPGDNEEIVIKLSATPFEFKR